MFCKAEMLEITFVAFNKIYFDFVVVPDPDSGPHEIFEISISDFFQFCILFYPFKSKFPKIVLGRPKGMYKAQVHQILGSESTHGSK